MTRHPGCTVCHVRSPYGTHLLITHDHERLLADLWSLLLKRVA